jgi:hypothetical protein
MIFSNSRVICCQHGVVAKTIRVVSEVGILGPSATALNILQAAERHPYLTTNRFPCSWANSAILQRYLNNVRGYQLGKKNPSSGVNRRRQRVTRKGRQEAERESFSYSWLYA